VAINSGKLNLAARYNEQSRVSSRRLIATDDRPLLAIVFIHRTAAIRSL
jgi:hypothetical protein